MYIEREVKMTSPEEDAEVACKHRKLHRAEEENYPITLSENQNVGRRIKYDEVKQHLAGVAVRLIEATSEESRRIIAGKQVEDDRRKPDVVPMTYDEARSFVMVHPEEAAEYGIDMRYIEETVLNDDIKRYLASWEGAGLSREAKTDYIRKQWAALNRRLAAMALAQTNPETFETQGHVSGRPTSQGATNMDCYGCAWSDSETSGSWYRNSYNSSSC